MQVTIEDLSPVEKKLAVEIPWTDVKNKLDEAYRELGKGAQMHGFRRGKVPRPILERMYGKQVEQEVVKELVRESIVKAYDEHKLKPVAEPVVDETPITNGEPLRYSARIEVRPEIEPKDYFDLTLTRRAPVVTDEQIAHSLHHKQDELTQLKKVADRAVIGDHDFVIFKMVGTVGEHKVEHDGRIDVSDPEHEPIPGLSQAIIGIPVDAKDHEVAFAIPADHPRKELAGREAKLKLTITDLREKLTPALDDEFAKDTGEAGTLAELKDKIRDKLLDADKQKAERELRDQAIKAVREKNPIQISPALVERQLDNVVDRVKLQLQIAGVDVRSLDETRIREELREVAADEVRGTLLLEAIGEKESVKIDEADLEKRLAEIASVRDRNVAKVKAEYAKEGRLDALRHALREEKTLDLILSRAKIEDAAPTAAPETQPHKGE
ncbi:MAG TPA: trigger factor [Polyangia bacterium]|jgi:trigger factor